MSLTNALRVALSATDTTIQMVSVNEFTVNGGTVTIDSEQISYSTATDYSLIGCTRGVNSTSPASHAVNALITLNAPTPPAGLDMEEERIINLADPILEDDAATKDYVDSVPASGISQLTGDVTAGPGSGSQAATLASVNANIGSFTNVSLTVNAKGLITAASSGTSGANTSLGNLSAVAINTSLIPSSNNAIDLGTDGLAWRDIYVRNSLHNTSTTASFINDGNANVPGDFNFSTTNGGVNNEIRLSGMGTNGLYIFSTTARNKGGFGIDDNGPDGNGRFMISPNGFASQEVLTATTGGVSITDGGSNPHDASAVLDAQSTTKGFLPPRVTTTQKNAISSPATGLMVFDTTLAKLSVWTGAAWQTVTSS